MKKFLSILLALTMLLPLDVSAFAADASAVTTKDMTFYFLDTEHAKTLPVSFIGDSDVPYVSLEEWGDIMTHILKNNVYTGQDISFALTYSAEGEVGKLTREDGYPMFIDCAADTIAFDDYDAFVRPDKSRVLIDAVAQADSTPENPSLFTRVADSTFERYGKDVVLDAGKYGIDFVMDGTTCYVPILTMRDILIALTYIDMFFTGDAVIFAKDSSLVNEETGEYSDLGEIFYAVEKGQMSEATAAFNYTELCFVFDNFYGLKEIHGIESLDALADETGLRDALKSTDPVAADKALYTVIYRYLDDLHSTFVTCSPLSGLEAKAEIKAEVPRGLSSTTYYATTAQYYAARAQFYPDGAPGYEEVGNTAYITFNIFEETPADVNYYETAPTAESEDTIGLMLYAYAQITRENSPIENVVLDLSCNGGGDPNSAVLVLSAFLGEGYTSIQNTMSGAMATGVYNCDLNLDHQFDEKDRGLLGKRLFCLTSPLSFSCGNFVPCVFKNSHKVMLVGDTTGGGSCIVLPLVTAYGSTFSLSGEQRQAFTMNGSFYDIDRGADPDFRIYDYSFMYDRPAFTEYINGIK